MARGRITVKVEAASRFQHTVQLDEAHGHHHQIGHDVAFLHPVPKRSDKASRSATVADDVSKGLLCSWSPSPRIFES